MYSNYFQLFSQKIHVKCNILITKVRSRPLSQQARKKLYRHQCLMNDKHQGENLRKNLDWKREKLCFCSTVGIFTDSNILDFKISHHFLFCFLFTTLANFIKL